MRITALLILVLFLVSVNVYAADVPLPVLKDRPDEINYSYGYQLGRDILTVGLEFKPDFLWKTLNEGLASPGREDFPGNLSLDYHLGHALGQKVTRRQIEFRGSALWQGLYDAIEQSEPRLAEAQMTLVLNSIMGSTNQQPEVTMGKSKTSPPAKKKYYRSKGQKFLAENSSRKDVISLPSGLQYKIIASGNGKTPKETDAVLVNYQGRRVGGQVFSDSASTGIPQEVVVSRTIRGWQEALKLMREGDRWELYVPRGLAYRRGGPMRGKAVVFDLELLEILPQYR